VGDDEVGMGKVLIGFLCAMVLHVGTAYALRCGTEVVSIRDPKIEVLRKCGDPVSIEAWTEQQVISSQHGHGRHRTVFDDIIISVAVEEWLYNFGPHRLIYWLRFENGYLARMGTLGYGYLE
jgi:hypothetical protein